jgi:predicted patatin/cPLA2 family phospholipase
MQTRHEAYNRQLALAEQLQSEGRALIIRPNTPLQVDRLSSDPQKLLALHDEGHADGKRALTQLRHLK